MKDWIRPAPVSGLRQEVEDLKARIEALEKNQEIQARVYLEVAQKYESLRQLVYKVLVYKAVNAQS